LFISIKPYFREPLNNQPEKGIEGASMTDTSNSLPGEEPTAFSAPESQEPAPVVPSIDEFPTMLVEPVAADEATPYAAVALPIDEFPTVLVEPVAADKATPYELAEEPVDTSTFIISPAALEAATYVAPAEAEPPTLVIPPAAVLPVVSAPDYEVYHAEVPVIQPQYTPLPGSVQTEPYFAPPQPDGQPGYYAGAYQQQQPGWTGAPVPPSRKPRRGWLVLAIVLLVLLIGGGTVFAIVATRGPGNTPTQVLQQYCDAYKTYNAQELYNTLDAAGQAKTSLSQIQQSFNALKSLGSLVTISSCKVSDVQQSGSRASGTVTLTESVSLLGISSSSAIPLFVELLVENNLWKVDPSTTTTPDTQPTFPPGLLTPTDTGTNQ
jgi:hypothetical protein